jgi:hypothetical protein
LRPAKLRLGSPAIERMGVTHSPKMSSRSFILRLSKNVCHVLS